MLPLPRIKIIQPDIPELVIDEHVEEEKNAVDILEALRIARRERTSLAYA
jgi:hypothetical protein